eukprot:TRINITY_DN14984_c0_g1_i1.p1 TRINITY_DN14984_c0_g1~~TRINITY_DN14984_c0_g1_i1.p1  ORF type:complete len:156 (-),score=3.00 TRINITY_DN14984_c0_g1_i1:56-523(-)
MQEHGYRAQPARVSRPLPKTIDKMSSTTIALPYFPWLFLTSAYFKLQNRAQGPSLLPQGWRNKNNSIPPNEKEGHLSFRRLHDFFICFLVGFQDCCRLLHISQNHIQVLVISMEFSAELTLPTKLNVNALVQTQANEVQGFFHSVIVVRHGSYIY